MEMNTERKRILFADDDPEIREVVRILLEHEGFEVIEAGNGKEAVEKADQTVDLIILDVMMPGKSGILACLDIRKKLTVPILFLTARTQDSDKALGFSAGGDDYLAKPFSYTELVARVKAMLRRCYVYQGGSGNGERTAVIRIKDLSVDRDSREVRLEGEEILLTDLEYRILLLMAENRGKIFTIQNIYESVWEEPYYYTSNNTVMVHIRNLRKKLEKDPKNPKYLVNVWGKGYRIE
nr:response regulator transcription factor [uncultured Clostridium sp.]